MFSDDTFFIIRNQKDHDLVRCDLSTYEKASGAKANVSKTEILPIGPNTHSEANKLRTDVRILPYEQEVKLLGVMISNTDHNELVWNRLIQKIYAVLQKWSCVKLSIKGKILLSKTVLVPILLFQAKFSTIPTKTLKLIERIIWNYIKTNDSRMVSLETALLPYELGGLEAPNLDAIIKAARISWIKNLLDPENPAEWKLMALHELDKISKTPDMGINVLLHPKLLPKNKNLDFWAENLSSFFKCEGKAAPIDASQDVTISKLLQTDLAKISDNIKAFVNKGITQIKQLIDHVDPQGNIVYMTHSDLKKNHKLKRNVLTRQYDELLNKLPKKVVPPKDFKINGKEDTFILDTDEPEDTDTVSAPKVKRLKQNENVQELYELEPDSQTSQVIENIAETIEFDNKSAVFV